MMDIIDSVNLDVRNGQTILRGKRLQQLLTKAMDLREENARLCAELEQAQQWIPVGERMPEAGQVVLLYIPVQQGGVIRFGYLTRHESWRTWGGEYIISSAKAWQPLPEAPTE